MNTSHRSGRQHISNKRDERNLINLTKKDRRLPANQQALKWKLQNEKQASPVMCKRYNKSTNTCGGMHAKKT